MIKRKKTHTVKIGNISTGSAHPIVIQSMTNTPTADVSATVKQVKQLADAGSELVRITINDEPAMRAIPRIIKKLRSAGYQTPIIGDFHYNGHILLEKYPQSAKLLDKYRINPGNLGKGNAKDNHFSSIVKIAIKNKKPIRIGVNSGSLDQELLAKLFKQNSKKAKPKTHSQIIINAMVQSALQSAKNAKKLGLAKNKIILSVKMSNVQDVIRAYQQLSKQCDYVLHLGLTEAGGETQGIIASVAALSALLQKGIGDTIRVSLTPTKKSDRCLEVSVCKNLLQSIGLRFFSPAIISCPGCGRTINKLFQSLACDIRAHVEKKLPSWKKKFYGVEKLKIAVMGCIVNGPGESKHANIGICLSGTNEKTDATVYIDGKCHKTLKQKSIKDNFLKILEKYIQQKYS